MSTADLNPADQPMKHGGLRILVVEDDTDTAATLATLLGLRGHEVEIATDGPGAIRLADVQIPDVVLLDIGLPGIDGYEVAKRLRQIRKKRILIIATTGYGRDTAERLSSYEAGIDLHLTKPVCAEELECYLAKFQAVARPQAR